MKDGFEMLVAAVAKSVRHELSARRFTDRLIMQKGCFILNSWHYGPIYHYNLYIRGPYSKELADDYYRMKEIPSYTDIPPEAIADLTAIFDKGLGYAEAYATVLLIKENSKDAGSESILNRALELKPRLESEVREACAYLLN